MSYLKKFIEGGLIALLFNFVVLNALVLYYDIYRIDINTKLNILNIPLVSVVRTPNEFGYVLMRGGIFLSILIGGIIALLIYFIFQHKKKFFNV